MVTFQLSGSVDSSLGSSASAAVSFELFFSNIDPRFDHLPGHCYSDPHCTGPILQVMVDAPDRRSCRLRGSYRLEWAVMVIT
jgi:hypothetical protein